MQLVCGRFVLARRSFDRFSASYTSASQRVYSQGFIYERHHAILRFKIYWTHRQLWVREASYSFASSATCSIGQSPKSLCLGGSEAHGPLPS